MISGNIYFELTSALLIIKIAVGTLVYSADQFIRSYDNSVFYRQNFVSVFVGTVYKITVCKRKAVSHRFDEICGVLTAPIIFTVARICGNTLLYSLLFVRTEHADEQRCEFSSAYLFFVRLIFIKFVGNHPVRVQIDFTVVAHAFKNGKKLRSVFTKRNGYFFCGFVKLRLNVGRASVAG